MEARPSPSVSLQPICGNQAGETCPHCFEATLREEGAHGRCERCGWIGKCCE